MLPPSATDGRRGELTVVVLIVSVTLGRRRGRIDRQRFEVATGRRGDRGATPSSRRRAHRRPARPRSRCPVLAPAAIVIVAPLLSVTLTGVCAALVSDAVWNDGAAFGDARCRGEADRRGVDRVA